MNWYIVSAGIFALFTTIGHFTVGSKMFLKPMLEADFDQTAQKVMHCVFHYISTFLVLSTIYLLLIGFGKLSGDNNVVVVQFIGLNYLFNAIAQLVIALTSKLEKPLFKLFQWSFFTIIAVLCWYGTCCVIK